MIWNHALITGTCALVKGCVEGGSWMCWLAFGVVTLLAARLATCASSSGSSSSSDSRSSFVLPMFCLHVARSWRCRFGRFDEKCFAAKMGTSRDNAVEFLVWLITRQQTGLFMPKFVDMVHVDGSYLVLPMEQAS